YQGKWAEAQQDIDWCVKRQPTGVTLYAAACVYAQMAAGTPDPPRSGAAADRAVALLGEAFAVGYGPDRAAADEDLAGIRRHPRFIRLLKQHTAEKPRYTPHGKT